MEIAKKQTYKKRKPVENIKVFGSGTRQSAC